MQLTCHREKCRLESGKGSSLAYLCVLLLLLPEPRSLCAAASLPISIGATVVAIVLRVRVDATPLPCWGAGVARGHDRAVLLPRLHGRSVWCCARGFR